MPATPPGEIALLQNRTFDEISFGDAASVERTLSAEDIRVIAVLTGFAGRDPADSGAVRHLEGMIAHGMWGSALIAMVLGTRLPGPGATYLGESLAFRARIRPGDTITTRVEIVERDPESRRVRAGCRGGLDAFVFTAGVGENAPAIRARIVERLAWLGAELDPAANAAGGPLISTAASRIATYVVPTDEELMIARHTLSLLRAR